MLKDSLTILNDQAEARSSCRLFAVAKEMDKETREVFIRTITNRNVSGRRIHTALRIEGVRISRENLYLQRECMISEACVCRWDEIS